MVNGLLVIDKPIHYTSMDAIAVLRRLTGVRRIGHAGTLDPLATGVLLVCVGPATKHIDRFMAMDKEYVTTIDLSAFSQTDDAQGPLESVAVIQIPAQATVESCLRRFVGSIEQVPPAYSAIKVAGKRAYDLARAGKSVELKPRLVNIQSIELLGYQWPFVQIRVTCGKGVYIRSLARDIGRCLATGGYVASLQRTLIGPYALERAVSLEKLKQEPALVAASLESL